MTGPAYYDVLAAARGDNPWRRPAAPEPDRCPACGSQRLSWGHALALQGRPIVQHTQTQFYLGCDECSETVHSGITPDQVLGALALLDYDPRTQTWALPRSSSPSATTTTGSPSASGPS